MPAETKRPTVKLEYRQEVHDPTFTIKVTGSPEVQVLEAIPYGADIRWTYVLIWR